MVRTACQLPSHVRGSQQANGRDLKWWNYILIGVLKNRFCLLLTIDENINCRRFVLLDFLLHVWFSFDCAIKHAIIFANILECDAFKFQITSVNVFVITCWIVVDEIDNVHVAILRIENLEAKSFIVGSLIGGNFPNEPPRSKWLVFLLYIRLSCQCSHREL